MADTALSPAHLALIDALAERMVADYLTEQAASQQALSASRPNPVPLPDMDKAA